MTTTSTGQRAALLCVLSLFLGGTTVVAHDSNATRGACYFDETEKQATVAEGPAAGCFTESNEYQSSGRNIYTSDGGDVTFGSTYVMLGNHVSALLQLGFRLSGGFVSLHVFFVTTKRMTPAFVYVTVFVAQGPQLRPHDVLMS